MGLGQGRAWLWGTHLRKIMTHHPSPHRASVFLKWQPTMSIRREHNVSSKLYFPYLLPALSDVQKFLSIFSGSHFPPLKHHFFSWLEENSTHSLRITSNIISQMKYLFILLGKINYSLANSMRKVLLKYLSCWSSGAEFTFQITNFSRA